MSEDFKVLINVLEEYDSKSELYMGIDVGSVSTKTALISKEKEPLYATWSRNEGSPIDSVQDNFKYMRTNLPEGIDERIKAVGTTGSARKLIKNVVGANIDATEIIAHGRAAAYFVPNVKTVLEIGGQDSKVIILNGKGLITDYNMNSICAAGTGSFLDHQANRLGIEIEEFGGYAAKSECPVSIAGRCTVFAESDMIHKTNAGHNKTDIIGGLCNALVSNYLNNVCKRKELHEPIVFQGGVAANAGIVKAFEEELCCEITVPKYFYSMGAIGMAIIAKEEFEEESLESKFKGFDISDLDLKINSWQCKACANNCEIKYVETNGESGVKEKYAQWDSRCGKWNM